MKTAIVYYSLEGNTAWAAEQIAKHLGADLIRLEPVKAYPTGKVSKFVWGGKSAVMSETPELQPYSFDAADYGRVILGFPVWASAIAPPLRTFLRTHDLKGKQIAVFACQMAKGAEKAYAKLKEEFGFTAFEAQMELLDPKAKPDPNNEAIIQAFCDKLQ